ncbi:MAG: hypothetical protein WD273_06040 [Trueperaceae bacterium]
MQVQPTVNPFSNESVSAFAAAWFRALDVHAPADECLRLLADDGLEMVFPEKTLHGIGDFLAWYAGGNYSDGSSAPGVVNIFFDEVHTLQSVNVEATSDEAAVEIVVGWQASWFTPPAAKSLRTSMNATQQWRLQRASGEKNLYGLEIRSYNAQLRPFEYAPGFATL